MKTVHKILFVLWCAAVSSTPHAQTPLEEARFFVVGPNIANSAHPEEFVVPVRTEEELQLALEELSLPWDDRTRAGVRFEAGVDWINRDHSSPGKRLWHWRVTRLRGFSEGSTGTSVIPPSFIESNPEAYVENSGGSLNWGRLLRELSKEEVFWVAPSAVEEGVRLDWMDLGGEYVYTVETSVAGSGMWEEAPGGEWPASATSWIDTAPNGAGVRLYRVRAEIAAGGD